MRQRLVNRFFMPPERSRARQGGPRPSFGARRSELFDQLRHGLEQVGHQPVVGNLEDRRLLVLVDGDDDLRILHPRQMLDGAGDADRHIEVRRHHLAGLADLPVVRREARVDGDSDRIPLIAQDRR